MEQTDRPHDAAAVELAAGWIALCATCGWVGETYGSEPKAATDCARHIAEAPSDRPERDAASFLRLHSAAAVRD
jgi:hypothetical protein